MKVKIRNAKRRGSENHLADVIYGSPYPRERETTLERPCKLCQPFFPSPSAPTTSYHDRNHQRGLSGVVPHCHARETGRQADRHQGHATAARKLLFVPPSLLILSSQSLLSSLSTTLDFFPLAEKCLPPLGDLARRPGLGQTTCMQLGLAWRAAEKALKDRTGQDRVSQTGSRLALSLSLPH